MSDSPNRAPRYYICGVEGPTVERNVPNGWRSSPRCTLIEDHVGPHRYVGQVGGGFTIEWEDGDR